MHEEFGAPRAHQAADAEHLAFAGLESDAREERFGPLLARDGEALDFQNRFSPLSAATGEKIRDLAPDHGADDLRVAGFLRGLREDLQSVSKHGDAVGDREHFLEFVGDEGKT